MELTILRRVAAVTALSAAAALSVTPGLGARADASPVAATASALRADSSLSIRAVKPAVAPGRSTTLKGRLATPGADPAGRTVLLEARSEGSGGFVPVGTATTAAAGMLRLTVTPETTTAYRWHYAGGVDADRERSGIARVRVRLPHHQAQRVRTTLSIRLKDLTDRSAVRGRLFARGARVERRWVVLASRAPGAGEWSFAGADRTDARGRVSYGVVPQQDTTYRLAFLGTPRLRPARSARVVVRTASDVSVSAVPGVIDPGGTSTVSGAVTRAGAAVGGATVRLLARPVREGARWSVAQTATSATDGTVTFAVTPARTTAYRLRVVHSPGVRRGTSDVARVVVRTPSSLSVRGRSVRAGWSVAGQLRGRGSTQPHRDVTLQAIAPGAADWTAIETRRTNARGRVFFVQPEVDGTQYRLVFDGDDRLLPSTSGIVVS